MPLQRNQTLSTGLSAPQAYGEVVDWNLQGQPQIGLVTIKWWATKAAHDSGMDPILTEQVTLTYQEQLTGKAQLLATIQNLIVARPAYSGTLVI